MSDGSTTSVAAVKRPRKPSGGKNRYDSALIEAKRKGSSVRLTLALETDYTNAECVCQCKILEVDTFSVKIEPLGFIGREVWIGKSFIVSSEILT